MPTAITIGTTFATESGLQPASQLDANFTQLVNANNSLNTFNTYFVDAGGVGTISFSVSSPLAVSLTAGLLLQIQVANANTGSVTINVNALGAKALLFPDGTAMVAGVLSAGQIIVVQYNGTYFQLLSPSVSQGSFPGTLTGCTTSPTGTLFYTRNSSDCTLFIPAMTGTSNTNTLSITGLPALLQPARQIYLPVPDGGMIQNTVAVTVNFGHAAVAQINSGSNAITFLLDTTNSWTAGGTKGVNLPFSLSYPLN